MRTLILVSVGSDVLSLEPSDFPVGCPVEGRIYEFEGSLHRVVEITETLGVRGIHGNKLSGDLRFLAFAEAVCKGDEKLKNAFLKPKKVGKDGLEDVVSKGGIIVVTVEEPKPELATPFDHLIFVRTVPVDQPSRLPQRGVRLHHAAATLDVDSLLDTDGTEIPAPRVISEELAPPPAVYPHTASSEHFFG